MEMSICQQLDVMGMQPHAREYVEYRVVRDRSEAKAARMPGVNAAETCYDNECHKDGFAQWNDNAPLPLEGIQYSGRP